ncbi:MAG: cysteine desulfurase [Candidatus Korarchaeota archaeon]|nr:cysteine desulfurase [Candidatus Korarchaeota archaeon]NIU84516.1 SufS family cysteine desulfurase [Candidatus Thorarchaeota archaeon]NIW14583.1 SufS family cysteine desulfurase [Candidatus Thorarchaeota archaeon]NIW52655.1 SufS family cysteine desulfurase [Candidatus Korarchaeota archaeon]
MDVEKIRRDFPILTRKIHDTPTIYLDNTATSQKPTKVINAVKNYYEKYNANIHRGIHDLSQEASEMYDKAHKTVAEFIHANSKKEIIFVRNTTEAINLVAKTFGTKLKRGDEILTTLLEHHSNILPWLALEKERGIKVKFVKVKENGVLDLEELKEKLTGKTKLIAITHISNVLGTILPVKEITKIAHEKGALVLVDGAQSAPHMSVDVNAINCDFFAFSGHKMLGPTGIGVLYGKEKLLNELPPYQRGGGAIDKVHWVSKRETCTIRWKSLPWKFEAGTPNIAGGIGLAEAVKYLESVGMDVIRNHERKLTSSALKQMEEIDGVTIYGPKDPNKRAGILSFTIEGELNYHEVAGIFNEYGICVRSGFHCAQPLHEFLGSKGSVRASFYLYNTKSEVEQFLSVLTDISEM